MLDFLRDVTKIDSGARENDERKTDIMIREALIRQFGASFYTTQQNSEGVTHEESLIAPPGGGSSLNWVVGHMFSARNTVFKNLGHELGWTDDVRKHYGQGSEGEIAADVAAPFAEILEGYAGTQERLAVAITEASDEQLASALENPHPILGKTVGELITTLAFHEAYHAGQTGVLRRLLGKEGKIA